MDGLVSFIAGSVLTIIVSWYFYRKSIQKKKLTPYLDYFSKLFDKVETELKKDLKILYKDTEIETLYTAQFTVENSGDKSIRDLIKPLTVSIPLEFQIIDASITEINPEGRTVAINHSVKDNTITIDFDLLNSKDFFIFRLLFKGDVISYLKQERKKVLLSRPPMNITTQDIRTNDSATDYIENKINYAEKNVVDYFLFSISVDELPPRLVIQKNGRNEVDSKESTLFKGSLNLVIGLSMFTVLYFFTISIPSYFVFYYNDFFGDFYSWFVWYDKTKLVKIPLFVTWIVQLYFLLRGTIETTTYLIRKIAKMI